MRESIILDHFQSFNRGNSSVILPVWEGVKNATKLNILFDPTRCLTRDDFNQLGLCGVFKAFKTYAPDKGRKLRTWIISLSNQSMLKEVYKKTLDSVPFSSIVEEDFFDNLIMKISTSFEPSFIFEEYYSKLVSKISDKLYNKNRKIYDLFNFKLENPDLDASAAMNILEISTVYYKYLDIIKETIMEVLIDL